MILKNNFYVITGGPGCGKTTLIDELCRRGYDHVPEAARAIIRQQVNTHGDALPWMDTRKYSDMMLSWSVRDFTMRTGSDRLCFFDRGIPDTYGYEILMGFDGNPLLEQALNHYRYNPKVFILPPWKEIYLTDTERKQDFQEALRTYRVIKDAYKRSGYRLVEIPPAPVSIRADMVEKHMMDNEL